LIPFPECHFRLNFHGVAAESSRFFSSGCRVGLSLAVVSGGSFGTSAQVVLFPRRREGYALLANDACQGTEGALRAFALGIHERMRSDDLRR
jgi:hypothetical protein